MAEAIGGVEQSSHAEGHAHHALARHLGQLGGDHRWSECVAKADNKHLAHGDKAGSSDVDADKDDDPGCTEEQT